MAEIDNNTVNNLPTTSSLKDVIDRQELLNNSIEIQKNNLKNILVSKNVEIAEEENKLSNLIDKVNELGDAPPPPLYLYREGDECTNVTGGFETGMITTNGSVQKLPTHLQLTTTSAGNYATFVTSTKINLSNYSKLVCRYKKTVVTSPRFSVGVLNSKNDNILTSSIAFSKDETLSQDEEIIELNIIHISSGYVAINVTDRTSASVFQIWLEK